MKPSPQASKEHQRQLLRIGGADLLNIQRDKPSVVACVRDITGQTDRQKVMLRQILAL
jgi:hypothetical protein